MTCYVLKGEKRPVAVGAVDPVTGQTFPSVDYLVYTNPATHKHLTNDDDNSNNLNDYYGRVRSATIQVTGGSARIATNVTATASVGLLLQDGDIMELENQQNILLKCNVIAASGTPIVFVQLWS